jgi:hypothetical protein
VTRNFLRGEVEPPRPTPNLEAQWIIFSLVWMTLPGAYAPASIALGVIRVRKPPHLQHVLRQGGSPWGVLLLLLLLLLLLSLFTN